MNLAFTSKHPFVPNITKNPLGSRWIASLSDGSTVFEDITPGQVSAWHRLREYIQLHNLKLTNLRLEAYGRRLSLVPYTNKEGKPQIDGYFYSKRQNSFIGKGANIQWQDVGIGFVKDGIIFITWISENGFIQQEIRELVNGNLAVIINHRS